MKRTMVRDQPRAKPSIQEVTHCCGDPRAAPDGRDTLLFKAFGKPWQRCAGKVGPVQPG